nr:MAG TPA: hypothetical protein [Caudoviricetes sp.]
MKINVINNIPKVRVICNENNDGSYTITLKEDKRFYLLEAQLGSIVKIGNREYIVLEHSEETKTTAVITKDFAKKMKFGESGSYLTSDVRKYCKGEFYNELVAAVGAENIVRHIVKLVADDNTGESHICWDNVSVITTENYRRYREFLKVYGDWWWTATRVTYDDEYYARNVCCVGSCGALCWYGCDYYGGVRPFCILKSSILVTYGRRGDKNEL